MNKKKVLLLIAVVLLLFTMTGCSIPRDANDQNILIGLSDHPEVPNQIITSFSEIWEAEGFFSAIFVYPLSQFINWLTPFSDVGVAILVVAITINAILLLFTFKQNVAMQKMQMIQPEVERIQRKYEGKTDQHSQLRMSTEIQNLYKKNQVNPFGSLVVTFIQFPILIVMYHAVQRAYAVAYGRFLGISLEVSPINGIMDGNMMYLVLFVLMVIAQASSMLLPQYLSKRRAKKEAELHHRPYRETKNPMMSSMYIMVAVISLVAITWPTAMSLYWMISSLINIVKTLLVQRFTNRQKAKEAL